MRERRLAQSWRDTPFRCAHIQGREEGGRRDDIVLLSALTNPATLAPWLDALERQRSTGPERRIVLIAFETLDFVPLIGASILVGGTEVGKVTSADRGYTVGKALALGYVSSMHAKEGQDVMVTGPDGAHAGKIHLRAVYDPDGVRVRT